MVFADTLRQVDRQGKASLGQVVLDGIGVIPGGRQVGLLAQGGKAVAVLGGLAAGVRAGRGTADGAVRAGIPGGRDGGAGGRGLRGAMAAGGDGSPRRWYGVQKAKQFFSKDPVHFPTGTVLLPQTGL
ncbi:hypothetical protein GCM10020220_017140 [Nonomuraea rubra]|uniref:hypothetical protein n=1 Tax=Nonomuraea rubra TaxID=46180 RepID=UPI0031ED103A